MVTSSAITVCMCSACMHANDVIDNQEHYVKSYKLVCTIIEFMQAHTCIYICILSTPYYEASEHY